MIENIGRPPILIGKKVPFLEPRFRRRWKGQTATPKGLRSKDLSNMAISNRETNLLETPQAIENKEPN